MLEYFNYTQAKNGGPIALMMKDNILLAQGGKNKVFIFDAYGKLFKIIDVSSHASRAAICLSLYEITTDLQSCHSDVVLLCLYCVASIAFK